MIINGREISTDRPPYIVAEIGASHGGDLGTTKELIQAAKTAGADAVKFQAYWPHTLTIDHDGPGFILTEGPWAGRKLYDLYQEAHTPWSWFPELASCAKELGITWFSSVFDQTSIDYLETLHCPAYKIASMEIVDLELIKYASETGKPVIISTGMAGIAEILDAANTCSTAPVLLHCVSGYPTPVEEAGLYRMHDLDAIHGPIIGISDHSTGTEVPAAATVMGAVMIERHIRRFAGKGLDNEFASNPHEFARMVQAVRRTWCAMQPTMRPSEASSRQLRRSLYVVEDMEAGERFRRDNVRSIRPGHGLPPKVLPQILEKVAARAIKRGEPLTWEMTS